MADLIKIDFNDQVGPLLARAEPRIRQAVQRVVSETASTAFARIVNRTPRDSGDAAAGWALQLGGDKATITNDVAYINVLEHGGYPVIPLWKKRKFPGGLRRGNAALGGNYPPGPRTVRADSREPIMLQGSNVSRQAPHGMVRLTLGELDEEFAFNLEEAIDRALNGGVG